MVDERAGNIGDNDNESPFTNEDGNEDDSSEREDAGVVSKETTKQRRSLVDDKLKNYRQEKLKRKLPLHTQLLGCAQEELRIKKRGCWMTLTRWIRSMKKTWKECHGTWRN